MKQFIILSTQRSGSTIFRLYVNSHPYIRLSGEVFVQHDYQYDGFNHFLAQCPLLFFLKQKKYMESWFALNLNKLLFMCIPFSITRKYLRSLFYNPNHSAPTEKTNTVPVYIPNLHFEQEKARGFKLMYNQLKWTHSLKHWIVSNNISVIHLIRQNLLRVFISLQRLKKGGVAHTVNQIATKPVQIAKEKLFAFILKVKRERKYYKKIFSTVPYMEVFFEDFLLDTDKEKTRILDFLDIEDAEMKMPALKKISSIDIKNDIAYYDEIASFLKEKGLGNFLC
jgi:LPS sulfotransferase NodH